MIQRLDFLRITSVECVGRGRILISGVSIRPKLPFLLFFCARKCLGEAEEFRHHWNCVSKLPSHST
jgi:hypothetical protein